jgi:hypothetical protein
MRKLGLILTGLFALVLIVGSWQQWRYLDARRNIVADQQAQFYSTNAFHVATVLSLSPDQSLLPAVGQFVDTVVALGGKVIYAGKGVANAINSKQISQASWDAFVLTQYDSEVAYQSAASTAILAGMLSDFEDSYSLAMERPGPTNYVLPLGLLGLNVVNTLRGYDSPYPFTPAQIPAGAPPQALAKRDAILGRLRDNREYGENALVIVNFTKQGSAAQQDANASYGLAMMSLMARLGHGPMHMGRAITLQGDAEYDNVIIVFYPGVDYFAELLQSEFFSKAVQGKQLGDTLSLLTVPLLPHLY